MAMVGQNGQEADRGLSKVAARRAAYSGTTGRIDRVAKVRAQIAIEAVFVQVDTAVDVDEATRQFHEVLELRFGTQFECRKRDFEQWQSIGRAGRQELAVKPTHDATPFGAHLFVNHRKLALTGHTAAAVPELRRLKIFNALKNLRLHMDGARPDQVVNPEVLEGGNTG